MSAAKRLLEFHTYLKNNCGYGGRNVFEKELGKAEGYLTNAAKKNTSIGSDVLYTLYLKFSDLNLMWLITGDGSMIVNHSENVNYIYHYTSIKNYLSIMSSRYILLSDLSRSDDLRERNISSNKKVACFCCGGDECDKPLMWSKYAENETGVCIKFDLGKIMEVNEKLGKFEGIKVKYKPSKFFTTRQDSGVELEYKHIDWEHQNEYRFVSSEIDRLLINKECVKGVIFGGSVESVEDEDVKKVFDLTKRAGLFIGVVSVNGSRFEMPKFINGDMDFDTFSFEAGKLRDSAFGDTDIDLELENIRMSAGSDKIMEEYDKLLAERREDKMKIKEHIKKEEELRKKVEELELLIKKGKIGINPDVKAMNPRVKATLDAIDKRIKEAEERREEERLEEEYLLNGGMRVIKFGEVTEVTNKEKFDLRKLNEHLLK